jgi:hypothetical protein
MSKGEEYVGNASGAGANITVLFTIYVEIMNPEHMEVLYVGAT